MGRYVSWMSVATLLRAPAPHSARSFALAALSLKGVRSALSPLGLASSELPVKKDKAAVVSKSAHDQPDVGGCDA